MLSGSISAQTKNRVKFVAPIELRLGAIGLNIFYYSEVKWWRFDKALLTKVDKDFIYLLIGNSSNYQLGVVRSLSRRGKHRFLLITTTPNTKCCL